MADRFMKGAIGGYFVGILVRHWGARLQSGSAHVVQSDNSFCLVIKTPKCQEMAFNEEKYILEYSSSVEC